MNVIPRNLDTLNLHKNFLAQIYPPKEDKNLLYLDLSGNNIESFTHGVFVNLPKLKFLRLSNNMIKSLDFYKYLPLEVTKLDMRTNLLETLRDDHGELINFGHLPSIEDLYISQNLWICSCDFKNIIK